MHNRSANQRERLYRFPIVAAHFHRETSQMASKSLEPAQCSPVAWREIFLCFFCILNFALSPQQGEGQDHRHPAAEDHGTLPAFPASQRFSSPPQQTHRRLSPQLHHYYILLHSSPVPSADLSRSSSSQRSSLQRRLVSPIASASSPLSLCNNSSTKATAPIWERHQQRTTNTRHVVCDQQLLALLRIDIHSADKTASIETP